MQRYILLDATGVELWTYSDGKSLAQLMEEGWEARREIPYGASWMLILVEKPDAAAGKKPSSRRNSKAKQEPEKVS
ncbi:hypothetical protein BH23PLA1_BH23PLA1_29860 [soil metagenome]